MYPVDKMAKFEREARLLAIPAGVSANFGADFAKINYPKKEGAQPSLASNVLFRERTVTS